MLLLQAWGVPPANLLMVGDSTEDVETGNAAGTASCLIAGGGNELPVPSPSPSGGATVHSLFELLERLQKADTPLGWRTTIPTGDGWSSSDDEGFASDGEWAAGGLEAAAAGPGADASSSSSDAASQRPGSPPPGIGFLDWLFLSGAVQGASCSFPRVVPPPGQRGEVPPDEHPGEKASQYEIPYVLL